MENRQRTNARQPRVYMPLTYPSEIDEQIQMLSDEIMNSFLSQTSATSSLFQQPNYLRYPQYYQNPYYQHSQQSHQHRYYDEPHYTFENEFQTIIHMLRDIMSSYNQNMSLFIETINSIQNNLHRLASNNRNRRNTHSTTRSHNQQHQQQQQIPPVERRHPNRNTYNTPRAPAAASAIPQINPQPPYAQANPRNSPLFNAIYTIFTTPISDALNSMEDVIIRPSEQQIQGAMRQVIYHSTTENISSNCPITLENFEEGQQIRQIIHCGHCFNEEAINNWFRAHVRCPVCRYDIRGGEQPAAQTQTPPQQSSQPDIVNNDIEDINDANSDSEAYDDPEPEPLHQEPSRQTQQEFYRSPPTSATTGTSGTNIDQLLNNLITSGLSNLLGNTSIPSVSRDASYNTIYTFDLPIVYYDDLSLNYMRSNLDMVD